MSSFTIAVDIGGTFTDLVAIGDDGGQLHYTKALTTYDDLARGVEDCIAKANVKLGDAGYFMHGSTIAINTVIQNTGAPTGLLTTKGFRDVYEIGRSNRPDAYNLFFQRPIPLIPRDLRLEVEERMNSRGKVLEPLNDDSVREAVAQLRGSGVTSVAVVLLHSYANPAHEIRIGEIIGELFPEAHVSLSHQILREFREYERTSTTALNAYVAPIVSGYVAGLGSSLGKAGFNGRFFIMQSNGGTMSAQSAKARPVAMMESGPVAGVIGAAKLGEALGFPDLISFDMGGTTAKTSLIVGGEPRIVTGYHIGGYQSGHPMSLPVVDIVEVGTGGGSIAWLDASGGLKVGPISAGASPGPVCYGLGGTEPTVTDANLVLGRLDPNNFLGGEMPLDLAKAREAIAKRVAGPLGMSTEGAALGILKIADTKMSLAVREVSVAKGHDPRDFAIVASGGAGPLHAVSIARELAIPRVIVPELPGTFSAVGMLFSDVRHDYVQTFIAPVDRVEPRELESAFAMLEGQGLETLASENVARQDVVLVRSLDLRYQGQEYTLSVTAPSSTMTAQSLAAVRRGFDERHEAHYRHAAPQERVEIVNIRVSAVGRIGTNGAELLARQQIPNARSTAAVRRRPVYFDQGFVDCAVYARAELVPGQTLEGPAVIEEQVSTTVLFPGDRGTMHAFGPIIIEVQN